MFLQLYVREFIKSITSFPGYSVSSSLYIKIQRTWKNVKLFIQNTCSLSGCHGRRREYRWRGRPHCPQRVCADPHQRGDLSERSNGGRPGKVAETAVGQKPGMGCVAKDPEAFQPETADESFFTIPLLVQPPIYAFYEL